MAKSARREFFVPSDFAEVPQASAGVLSFLEPLELGENALFDLRLCFEEALINAVKYGNRFRRDLKVRVLVEFDDEKVALTVEDQGRGFDPGKLADCTREDHLSKNRGRGIYLMRKLMDKVEYNPKGNRVCMIRFLSR